MSTHITIPGDAPDPGRSQAAARANAAGELWNDRLNNYHIACRLQRRAFISQHNIPTKPVGGTKRGKGGVLRRAVGSAPVDFSGVTIGGLFIAIELKSSSSDKASLPIDDRGIRFEQLDELAERMRYGQRPVLLWANDGVLGVLCAEGWVERVLQLHAGKLMGHSSRKSIPRDWFTWLKPYDLDWLTLIEQEAKR